MTRLRELIGVAVAGLLARKTRTLLIMLGPVMGVAAIVAAVGLSESAKGDLRQKLQELGTNLVIATADGTFAFGTAPTLPEEAVERAGNISTVEKVTGYIEMTGIQVLPSAGGEDFFRTVPIPVLAADTELMNVLDTGLESGRFLNEFDQANSIRSLVIGNALADEYGYLEGETRTLSLNGRDYAVVGVIEKVELVPDLDRAVLMTPATAERDWDIEQTPTGLYLRVRDGTAEETAEILPQALALGGSEGVSTTIPSSLLEAEAEVDTTLQLIVITMGGLALVVGGLGIANVMSISVIQRSSEIGIRRALGHTRGTIAGQFLLEALVVGVLGGIVGAGVGVVAIVAGSRIGDWVVTIQPALLVWSGALAVVVAVIFGIYPAMKAARLEPLETLRLG